MPVTIRPAGPDDAAAICEIHNQGIVDRVATLDTSTRTPDGVRAWLTGRGPRHPVIVAELDGAVAGWGSVNQFNPRAAYDFVADFSVYVDRQHRGQGIGRRLLDQLVDLARAAGHHKMVLSALASNAAGIGLYSSTGFSRVGIYREQGQLDGRWVDVIVMEKIL